MLLMSFPVESIVLAAGRRESGANLLRAALKHLLCKDDCGHIPSAVDCDLLDEYPETFIFSTLHP